MSVYADSVLLMLRNGVVSPETSAKTSGSWPYSARKQKGDNAGVFERVPLRYGESILKALKKKGCLQNLHNCKFLPKSQTPLQPRISHYNDTPFSTYKH